VRDYELGLEWQPIRFEFGNRSSLTELLKIAQNNRQQGNLLRLQAQFNFRNTIFQIKNISS
jgi:hypothetical protein